VRLSLPLAGGESGGPAIDDSGKVVGVIEARNAGGIVFLTPASDLTQLR
jgi:hypothetical protein